MKDLKLKLAKSTGNLSDSLYRKSSNPEKIEDTPDLSALLDQYWSFHTSLSDSNYRLTTIEWWKNWIEKDWTDTKEYVSEYHDCDNFAFYFSSRTSWLYNVNSALVAFGDIFDAEDKDKQIGRHAFNIIPTTEDELYCFEPMSDGLTKIEDTDNIIIGDWRYVPTWIIGF